jgi:hypothetical protein
MLPLLLDAGITFAELLKLISQGGVLGILIFMVFGGYKQWWVFGWTYREEKERTSKAEKERDDWRDLALHGTNLAEQTVDLFRRSSRGKD